MRSFWNISLTENLYTSLGQSLVILLSGGSRVQIPPRPHFCLISASFLLVFCWVLEYELLKKSFRNYLILPAPSLGARGCLDMLRHIFCRRVLLSQPTLLEVLLLFQVPFRHAIVNTRLVEVSQQRILCVSVFRPAILSVYRREFLDLFRLTVSLG